MSIEHGQVWATRGGQVATIEETNRDGRYPFGGYVTGMAGGVTWTTDGAVCHWGEEHECDLVELIHPRAKAAEPIVFDTCDSGYLTVSLTRTIEETIDIEVELCYGMSSDEAEEKIVEEAQQAFANADWDYVQDLQPMRWEAYTTKGSIVTGDVR